MPAVHAAGTDASGARWAPRPSAQERALPFCGRNPAAYRSAIAAEVTGITSTTSAARQAGELERQLVALGDGVGEQLGAAQDPVERVERVERAPAAVDVGLDPLVRSSAIVTAVP